MCCTHVEGKLKSVIVQVCVCVRGRGWEVGGARGGRGYVPRDVEGNK